MDISQSSSIKHLIDQIKIAKELSDMHVQGCHMLCFVGIFIALDILAQVFIHQNRSNNNFENFGDKKSKFKKDLRIRSKKSIQDICKAYPGLVFQNGLKGLKFSDKDEVIKKTYKLRCSLLHRFSTKDGYNISPKSSKTGKIIDNETVYLYEILSFIENTFNQFVKNIGEKKLNNIVDQLYFI